MRFISSQYARLGSEQHRLLMPLTLVCGLCLTGCGGGGGSSSGSDDLPVVVQQDWRTQQAPPEGEAVVKKATAKPRPKPKKEDTAPKRKPRKSSRSSKNSKYPSDHPARFEIVEPLEVALTIQADDSGIISRDQVKTVPAPEDYETNSFAVTSYPASEDSGIVEVDDLPDGVELPEGFVPVPGTDLAPNGWPRRIRCEKDESEMVLLSGGVSIMGADSGPTNSSPAIKVTVSPFYMDVTEVTLARYKQFIDERDENRNRVKIPDPLNAGGDPEEPVLGCWFNHARMFAEWAGKELPTEAEWEHAARGNNGSKFPWREGFPIWNDKNKATLIKKVAHEQLDKTPEGVFDLSGNAMEWCTDWYYENTFELAASKLQQPIKRFTGPRKKPKEEWRVVKGGGDDWAAWTRRGVGQKEKLPMLGFRCVLHLPIEEEDE